MKLTDLQRKRLNRAIVALTALAIPVFGLSRPGLAWTAEDRPVTAAVIEFVEDLQWNDRPLTRLVVDVVSEDRYVQYLTGERSPEQDAIDWNN
jgi:hypothetical protein